MPHVDYVFFYPHPDNPGDVTLTAAVPIRLQHLWGQVQEEDLDLASRVGKKAIFYVVRLSFWFSRWLFTSVSAFWVIPRANRHIIFSQSTMASTAPSGQGQDRSP